MDNIAIRKSIRPIRFGLLVQPNQRQQLENAINLNTNLWGGVFNPIIPVYHRAPPTWNERPYSRYSAKEIVHNYIKAFEPDYLVKMSSEIDDPVGFEKERILEFSDLSKVEDADSDKSVGMSVLDVYNALYDAEFKYVRKEPLVFYDFEQKESPSRIVFELAFGFFSNSSGSTTIKDAYHTLFKPKIMPVNEESFCEMLSRTQCTALGVGRYGLKSRAVKSEAICIFWLDEDNALDLIDYWNLRAMGWSIIPVPIGWKNKLQDLCKSYVSKWHKPLRGNPQIFQRVSLISRRVRTDANMIAFQKEIHGPKHSSDNPSVLLSYYPRIWDRWAAFHDGAAAARVWMSEKNTNAPVVDRQVSFSIQSPWFFDRARRPFGPKWANIVNISDYSQQQRFALSFPEDLKELDRLFQWFSDHTWRSTEGIVVLSDHESTIHWRMPDGLQLFTHWLRGRGWQAELSSAGKLTAQLIESIGVGFDNPLTRNEVLRNLYQIAYVSTEGIEEDKRSRKLKELPVGQWFSILRSLYHNSDEQAQRWLKWFIDKRILKVGLALKCPKCSQSTWYSLDSLRENLVCERCLCAFNFPAHNPPRDGWSYRVQGVFSVEKFSNGGYVVFLALRFMLNFHHEAASWVSSLELTKAANKLELDFGMSLHVNNFNHDKSWMIFGECKSYNRFTKADLARARRLSKEFPGSMIVFATLRDSLTSFEKRILSQFARSGRVTIAADEWRCPVVILTAKELFSKGAPSCWKGHGGPFENYANFQAVEYDLRLFCETTQRLHLGMESYSDFLRKKFSKQARRAEARMKTRSKKSRKKLRN